MILSINNTKATYNTETNEVLNSRGQVIRFNLDKRYEEYEIGGRGITKNTAPRKDYWNINTKSGSKIRVYTGDIHRYVMSTDLTLEQEVDKFIQDADEIGSNRRSIALSSRYGHVAVSGCIAGELRNACKPYEIYSLILDRWDRIEKIQHLYYSCHNQ